LECGFEIWLLKNRKDSPRVGNFELRIEIHLAIDGVDESVEPLAAIRVFVLRDNNEGVPLLEIRQ